MRRPRSRLGRGEANLGSFALRRCSYLKELPLLEPEHAGKKVGGELLDLDVEVAHDGVVIAARVLHGIFDLRKGILQRGEAFNGAKLRIRFGEREEALERAGEHIFRL